MLIPTLRRYISTFKLISSSLFWRLTYFLTAMSSQLQAILVSTTFGLSDEADDGIAQGESYLCEFMTNMKITCDAPRTVGSFCGRIDPKEVVETIRFRTYSGVDPRIPGRDLPPKEGIQLSLGLAAITLEAFLYEPDTRFNMSFNEQDIHIHVRSHWTLPLQRVLTHTGSGLASATRLENSLVGCSQGKTSLESSQLCIWRSLAQRCAYAIGKLRTKI